MKDFIIVEAVQILSFFIYGNLATKVFTKTSKFRALYLDPFLDSIFLASLPILTIALVKLPSKFIPYAIIIAILVNLYATVPKRIGLNRIISLVILSAVNIASILLMKLIY